jgi:hypothetical protein
VVLELRLECCKYRLIGTKGSEIQEKKMQTLDVKKQYLAVVNADEVAPESLQEKLLEAGFNVTVLGIPCAPNGIEFYEIEPST